MKVIVDTRTFRIFIRDRYGNQLLVSERCRNYDEAMDQARTIAAALLTRTILEEI